MSQKTIENFITKWRIQYLVLFSAIFFISACGYHLRGSVELPEELKRIYLKGGSAVLAKEIKTTLKYSDGKLVNNLQNAGLGIEIVKEKMDRRILSLSSTGRANEFELYYVLDFLLLDSSGKQLDSLQGIEINRDYFNDQEEVLGKNNEEKVIQQEMYRQAVQSIFRRAQIILERNK